MQDKTVEVGGSGWLSLHIDVSSRGVNRVRRAGRTHITEPQDLLTARKALEQELWNVTLGKLPPWAAVLVWKVFVI